MIIDAGARALYLGPSFTLGPHRNTVAVAAFGLDDAFRLIDAGGDAREARCALIAPGEWQHLDARGGAMAFLYLDPDDGAWRALAAQRRSAPDDTRFDTDAAIVALRALRSDGAPRAKAWSAMLEVLGLPAPREADAGIAAAMQAVLRDPGATHSATEAAARCGCAASTFQRRFRAQAGLPWRRWRLWQRLRHAARAVCEGQALTDAAHAAGFASGAHFSDAFRDTFGLPPSRLVDWRVAWRTLE